MQTSIQSFARSALYAALFVVAAASAPSALFAAEASAGAPASSEPSTSQLASPFPQVLSLVLSQDPQVRAAREAVNVSAAELKQTRSRLFPSAGVTTSVGQSDQTSLGQGYQQRNNRTEAFLRWNLFNGFNEQRNADNAYRMLTAQSQWLAASGALAIALGVAVPEELASPVRAGER